MMERKRQIKSEFNDSELIHFNVNANRLNVTIPSMFSQVYEADWARVPESQDDSSRSKDGQWRSEKPLLIGWNSKFDVSLFSN